MTKHLNRVCQSSSSTQQFLISKIESRPPIEITAVKSIAGQEALAEVFPDRLFGAEFIEKTLQALESVHQFGVIVIKIDDLSTDISRDTQGDILLDTSKSIDACCQKENGLWGQIEPMVFVCFLPDKSATGCINTAKDIQKKISALREETVSIGVSAYPAINFQKDDVLRNAYKALDHASFLGPNSVVSFDSVSLNISGDKQYAKGDIDGAIEEFSKALMFDPANVNVHNSLGVCYGVLGEFDKALKEFETAIWLEPEEFMAIYNIGMVNLLRGEKHKALEFFIQANSVCEDVFEVQLQIGRVYIEIGKPEESKNHLENAVTLQPTSGSAFRYLGDCYTALGCNGEAIAAYKSAVKQNPNDAASLSALGHLFDLQGENLEISTTFCLQSVEISPNNGLYRHRLGNLYLKQNRFEEALKEFEAAKKLGHDSIRYIEKIQNRMAVRAS
jgi:tetratricopeptide (TPR) repeat protein